MNSIKPKFEIRGWESQHGDFWCKYHGGKPDWFRNARYLDYLYEALDRAPDYGINTLMLMGRGDEGEPHTFVTYQQWPELAQQVDVAGAREQTQVLRNLCQYAHSRGVALYLWAHEIQLPSELEKIYPEVHGIGTAICPSHSLIWKLIESKYEELFAGVPELDGLVLVFPETQIKIIPESPCRCNRCQSQSGKQFLQRIIQTVSNICQNHGKGLIVRTFGHSWEEIDSIIEVLESLPPASSFSVMSKMVPHDFLGFELPSGPGVDRPRSRQRILEDVVGGEYRGKTHALVLPVVYYAKHLRRAAKLGASGAVFRLDHSAYPRSVFEWPGEFNVWVTAQLMQDPFQDLEALWRQWLTHRYGRQAAPVLRQALGRSQDIWEHSTNTFGFFCTSAHSHLAPFLTGPYNAYDCFRQYGPYMTRDNKEAEQLWRSLFQPDNALLARIIAEREEAVKWAAESLADLEKARDYLKSDDYQELKHYLELQHQAAILWRWIGEIFFRALRAEAEETLPKAELDALALACGSVLEQGRKMERQFGQGHWPLAPDPDGRGTELTRTIADLWGRWIDRVRGIKPPALGSSSGLPGASFKPRQPGSPVEKLYRALLTAARKKEGTIEIRLEPDNLLANYDFTEQALSLRAGDGQTLRLPLAVAIDGQALEAKTEYYLRIETTASALCVSVLAEKNSLPVKWFDRGFMPEEETQAMMARFVDSHLKPISVPRNREEWLATRSALRKKIVDMVGLHDWFPPTWPLNVCYKGTIQRDGYHIEKLTYESYPGMAVSALLYLPDNVSKPVPGIVGTTGHLYVEGKAADQEQLRSVNLVLRGCAVLSYDYIHCGERSTASDPTICFYGGGNDHFIRTFSFSDRTPTALEILDGVRALDVLCSRPEVDNSRIGFTGHSGGGNSTYWVSSLDDRVRLAVPVCSASTFDYWIRMNRNWDWHQRPFGIRRVADIGVLLALHAPQPMLIITSKRGTDDQEFPFKEAEASVEWARIVYRILGAAGAIDHVESSTDHGYQEDKRLHLYEWVERELQPPHPKGSVELPSIVEPAEIIHCGLPAKNLTLRDIYQQWNTRLPRYTSFTSNSKKRRCEEARHALSERLGIPYPLYHVRGHSLGKDRDGLFNAEFWRIETESGISLPGILLWHKDCVSNNLVVIPQCDRQLCQGIRALVERGYRVFYFDSRGNGKMNSGGSFDKIELGRTENWAWYFGRSWPGMRALDIMQVAYFWQARGQRVMLAAPGNHGWPVLLAGAVEPDAISVVAAALPYSSLCQPLEEGKDSVLSDVPGILSEFDIPDIAALISPRPLWIACLTNPGPFYITRRWFQCEGHAAAFHVTPAEAPVDLLLTWAQEFEKSSAK